MNLSTIGAFKHIHSKDAIVLTDAQVRQLQATLNGILMDIVDVCEENHLRYNLGGGTCLGAVRHHGFIPWDDDIDINMPRKDHDLFVAAFQKKYGDRYWVHTARTTKNYGLLLSRVLLKGTSVRTREDFWNRECGAFVDIFIIENTYDNAALRKVHGFGCMAFGFLQSCRKFYRDRKPLMQLLRDATNPPEELTGYRRAFRIKIMLGFFLAWMPLDGWIHAADRWYGMCRNEHSTYVSVPAGRGHFFGELYRREDFVETTDMLYAGRPLKVAKNYDLYLRRLYGDYHKIPKDADKEQHVFFAPFYLDGDGSAGGKRPGDVNHSADKEAENVPEK